MKTTFTKQFMIDNKGCYDLEKLMDLPFMKDGDEIKLQSILDSDILLKDKYWFMCRKVFTKQQNQEIAISVAEIILEIYEKKYPNNKAPREAIQAAKDYLNNVIGIDELKRKRAAAAAAADDADAAAYAAAAADAADAAAADDDADAAAYAAAAADAADAADDRKKTFNEILLINLIDFCERNGY